MGSSPDQLNVLYYYFGMAYRITNHDFIRRRKADALIEMVRCLWSKKRKKLYEYAERGSIVASTVESALAVARGEEAEGRSLVLFGNMEKVFDLKDLLCATAGVHVMGTFGPSFKANLEIGPVFVKILKDVKVSDTKFVKIFNRIGKTDHENLLPLRAHHCGIVRKLLVYDYMPMGSLSALLQRNRVGGNGKTPLKWDTMFGIIVGVARAIAHLHSLSSATFHGNIKPSNILLTTTLEARVSDYIPSHVAKSRPDSEHIDSDVGYCAPEVTNKGKLSQKADVYNFGVLLLELLTGKTPMFRDDFSSATVTLQRWIVSVVEEELTSEVFDLDLLRYGNVEEQLLRLLRIAINCTSQDPSSRPSMAEVRSQIEELNTY